MKNIKNSANNLLKLLNDVLDYSKMEAKKIELHKTTFNLLELINDINTIFKLEAYEKGLSYKTSYDNIDNKYLYGDKMRLFQVLTNIVSNAIKFTNSGTVELNIERVYDNRYRFNITDTGIGIKDEDKDKLFLSFTQADTGTTRKYGGTGLGLAIAKELIELMNGKIWIESEYGKGSSFIFDIELHSVDEQDIQKKQEKVERTEDETKDKEEIDENQLEKLFEKLKDAASKRRPHLCEPIINELDRYKMDVKTQELYDEVKKLIKKYKYDDAKGLLDER